MDATDVAMMKDTGRTQNSTNLHTNKKLSMTTRIRKNVFRILQICHEKIKINDQENHLKTTGMKQTNKTKN